MARRGGRRRRRRPRRRRRQRRQFDANNITIEFGGGGVGGRHRGSGGSRSSMVEVMGDVLEQATALPYDPILDYAGMVIQFGYVIQFSGVCPVAPFICSLHDVPAAIEHAAPHALRSTAPRGGHRHRADIARAAGGRRE